MNRHRTVNDGLGMDAKRRIDYIDALRGILMFLGVIFHTAMIFEPDTDWRVTDPQKSIPLGHLAWFIHIFRMQTFFLIAGSFCALLIQKHGENGFLCNRLKRVAVPLVATAILINPLVNLLSANPPPLELAKYFLNREWIIHLWFLNDLLVFCLLCFVGVKLGNMLGLDCVPFVTKMDDFLRQSRLFVTLVLLVALPVVSAMTPHIFWHLLNTKVLLLGIVNTTSLYKYFPYFLFGCALWNSAALNNRFVSIWFWLPALVLASALLWMAPSAVGKEASRYAEYASSLAAWGMASLCLALCRRFCSSPSRVFRNLSDASYSVYLVHLLFIMLIGPLVVATSLSLYAKFGLIATSVTALSLAFHHFLIRRVSVLSFLFNGSTKNLL